MKTTRRHLKESTTVKGLLVITTLTFAALMIGCGTGQEPQINSIAQGSHCVEECCGSGCGTGGSGATDLPGGTGGTPTTSVGGGGTGGDITGGTGGQGNTGNTGGTGGEEPTGGNVAGSGGTPTTSSSSSSGTESGGSGGTSSSSTTDTGGSSGSSSSASSSGTGGTGGTETPHSLNCTNWNRDLSFDAFKIDGLDVELQGGMWGTSGSNIYKSVATYAKGVIAHWNGSNWIKEDLSVSNPPSEVFEVWGSGADDVWVGARNYNGYLYHWNGSAWSDDANKPSAKVFKSVWGSSSSNVFLVGAVTGWVYKIWRKNGSSWIMQTIPSFSDYYELRRVWGLDANHVFVTGYLDIKADGTPDQGVLLSFDGSEWTKNAYVPTACKELTEVSGTSADDLYVTGQTDAGVGVVYHVTQGQTVWTPVVNGSVVYGPVWSKWRGTFLASGTQPPAQAGALRVTTSDEMSPPDTYPLDGLAYNPIKIWAEPGTNIVHLINNSANGSVVAGHYTGNCD